MNCILIRTKDKRELVTKAENLPSLFEFAKTFNAELYHAEYVEGKLLGLKGLAHALCDPNYQSGVVCKSLRKLQPGSARDRKHILVQAQTIRSFIASSLEAGKTVSLVQLRERYAALKLTDACLCNHISMVRKTLQSQGKQVIKVAAGKYRLA